MPLSKSKGNMYGFVSHCHTHLGGACPHACSYCYVQAMAKKFPVLKSRYTGSVRLIEDELKINYGSGKTIFIEHMNDLFAKEVHCHWIGKIINHCLDYRDNLYVFQSKNPANAAEWLIGTNFKFMFGTTIETNRAYPNISKAPTPKDRFAGLKKFIGKVETFLTIEPIMAFDVDIFADQIITAKPTFINIGADSKGCHLPEPTPAKVKEFVAKLQHAGIVIRKKVNLERILK